MKTKKKKLSCLVALAFLGGALLPGLGASTAAADIDVYVTPGTHTVNGRQWKTVCSKYSTTIDRCRTEIWATQITQKKGKFSESTGWVFNNLTYKPVEHSLWGKNPLANPGSWTEGGRKWKTECGTTVTGRDGCRSYIWGTVYARSGSRYTSVNKWTFNNIVRVTPGTGNFTSIPKPQPTKPPATGTASQQQAVKTAQSYLRFMSFSRQGLIDQLEYEGFSNAEAVYAVDSLKVDWKAQAVKKGASYLKTMAFSRIGLIEQLEYEDFTTAQATHGTDAQKADWNKQAARKAKEYLRYQAFSRSGLIDQLLYEGFTQSQAEYGARAVGL